MLESLIQKKIIDHAKKHGWFVVKTIKLNIAGMPDILLFKAGQTIFIEVKTEKGVQSELQKLRQSQLRAQGFVCEVVRSLEDFILTIKIINK